MNCSESKKGVLRPIALALTALATLTAGSVAEASSHREAPFITSQPKVDGTDFYMFRSYEPGRAAYTTIIADYNPLQNPGDGPNYYTMDQDAIYEIHIAKDGHNTEDLTFQFRFFNTLKDIQLPVGGKMVSIPLVQAGALSGFNPANLNVRESYNVTAVVGNRRTGTRYPITEVASGGTGFEKPADNIGDKTFGSATGYAAYAAVHQYNINIPIPGCTTPGKMFVGQRKDPFALALGQVFDLINLNPLGATSGNKDYLANKNVTSLILEVPTSCLVGSTPYIGGWTTASERQGRLLSGAPPSGYSNVPRQGGSWVQVSRLGMPLVNEVVIGLKDKDKFNSSSPSGDTQFADYVTNPTLPALIQILFNAPAPTNFPRTDLVAAFLTGVKGVNQAPTPMVGEMLRLNTSIAPTAMASQQTLGVLAGDNAGFPNGRRPGDDVVDASLRVAMGVLCVATGTGDALGVSCKPSDAPAGGAALTDGTAQSASMFQNAFPYLQTPLTGSP